MGDVRMKYFCGVICSAVLLVIFVGCSGSNPKAQPSNQVILDKSGNSLNRSSESQQGLNRSTQAIVEKAANIFNGTSETPPEFTQSNQAFIEKTIDNVNLGALLKTAIPLKSKVAILSMEKENTPDQQIMTMIDDQFVQSAFNAGFVPVERNTNSIVNLIKEGTDEKYSILRQNKNTLDPFNRGMFTFYKTHLLSANYIVSYRILECGLIYLPSSTPKSKGVTLREGLLKLHVRILKVSGSEVVFAKNVSGQMKDSIRTEFTAPLSNFHYTFFPHEYPLQQQESSAGSTK